MTTTSYTPGPPTPERLDQIRDALARLANPDVAFAAPYTWAAMLRDTLAALDQTTQQLAQLRRAEGRPKPVAGTGGHLPHQIPLTAAARMRAMPRGPRTVAGG